MKLHPVTSRWLTLAVLGGVLLHGAPALAQDAESLLQEGIVQLKVAKFNRALRAFKKARRLAKDPALKAQVNLQLGLTHGVLGQKARAKKAFRASLKAAPGLTFNREETKESVIALYDAVRQTMKGTIAITTDRKTAAVSIDGKNMGAAPLDRELLVGKHVVVATDGDGLYRVEAEVLVELDKAAKLALKLEFLGARLVVDGAPKGATAKLNGNPVGTPPLSLELKPGAHELYVEAPEHSPELFKVELKPGESRQLSARLLKAVAPATTTPPEPAPTTPEEPDPDKEDDTPFPTYSVIAASAAMVFAGAGVGFAVASSGAWDDFKNNQDDSKHDELESTVHTYDGLMVASFTVAGVAAAGSLLIYFLVERGEPDKDDDAETTTVRLRPSAGGVRLEF